MNHCSGARPEPRILGLFYAYVISSPVLAVSVIQFNGYSLDRTRSESLSIVDYPGSAFLLSQTERKTTSTGLVDLIISTEWKAGEFGWTQARTTLWILRKKNATAKVGPAG